MSALTDTVKDGLRLGVGLAVKAVIASAVTALPFLGIPGVNYLFSWGVNWVADKLLPYLEIFFVDRIIEIQVEAEKKAYEKVREELKAVLASHLSTPEQIQNASDDFDTRLSNLIRIRP